MINWGNIPLNSVIPFFFDAFAGSTGASITLTGLAVTDVAIYKGTSMTQRASDAGVVLLDTDGIDVDGVTGIHGFSIDTSDNTDAGFYAAGSFYTVVVASVTIDSQTVNFVAGTFYLTPATAIAGHQKVDVGGWLGTAPATPTVNGVPEVDLTHVAGSTTSVSTIASSIATLLADIGGVATAAADGDPTATDLLFAYIKQLINILVGTAGVVTFPAAAAPANAVSLSEIIRAIYDDTNELQVDDYPTSIAAIQADTDDIQTRLPAALVGGRIDASVGAMAAAVVTAAAVATGAIDADALAADAGTELADAIRARQLTESYAADGVAPTLEQAVFQIMQILHEFAISGTTLTVKKLDGTTTAMTFTLSDATNPVSLTRAT